MTHRIARLALAGAAVAAVVLPMAPAQASCINWFTTPDDCAKQVLSQLVAPVETCYEFSATLAPICLPTAY